MTNDHTTPLSQGNARFPAPTDMPNGANQPSQPSIQQPQHPQSHDRKPGAKLWGIVAAVSLVCSLIGGMGGAAIVNALGDGRAMPDGNQQTQMPGGSGNGMGEPPSGGMGGQDGSSDSDSGSGSGSQSSQSSSYESNASSSGSLTM